MRTEDIPSKGPSDWQPITDKPTLALLGKLAEECGELSAKIARCVIQGLDGRDPETGESNVDALVDELADVHGLSLLVQNVLSLDSSYINLRATRKYNYKKTWIDSLEKAKRP